jgi:hypothetical protein
MLQSLQYRLQRCKHVFSDGSVCRSNQVNGTPVCLEGPAGGRQSVHWVGRSFYSLESTSFLTDDFVIISRNHSNNSYAYKLYYISRQYL